MAQSVFGGENVQEELEVSVSLVILDYPLRLPVGLLVRSHQALHLQISMGQLQHLDIVAQDEEKQGNTININYMDGVI